ncbi:isoprenoid synthase domain-containing protein [Mycena galericulata]|nr:isoprenoid synthase domain-containing protein [Mycena galericulata]
MSTAFSDYATCVRDLLIGIGYRYEPFPPYNADYWGPFHIWILYTLGPTSSWNVKQLNELEHTAGGVAERAYPYATIQLKLLFAKLTAIALILDDSIEDETVYGEIIQFSHKLYFGEAQENGMLALYHENIKELSEVYGNDVVLRDLAVVPWITYIDACLIEKSIFTSERKFASTGNMPLVSLPSGLNRYSTDLDVLALKFPHYLRSKSGASEAYAAGIFKASTDQNIPLARFIRVLPDLTFFIDIMNDILSFHKEELAGETYNLIHLRTRSLSSSGARGSGIAGEWTPYDTLHLLCEEIKEATHRIDRMLRLEECERAMRGDTGLGVDEVDIQIAKQWRGWRDGYISWHFECQRYKLDFLKPVVFGCVDDSNEHRFTA